MSQVEILELGKYYPSPKKKTSLLLSMPLLNRFASKKVSDRRKVDHAGLWALNQISFCIAPGEVVGIIGANGAGKSTLLKIVARVTSPTTGMVRGHGRVASLLELGLGFQPDMTARENISLYSALYGIPRKVVRDRFDAIVEFADLGAAIDNPLRTFSSGMYLRLAFSVAANLEPDILLADEVLAVGDIGFQERCIQRVNELRNEGRSVLFVSHDMLAIRRMCSRTLWLHKGRLRQIGDTDDVVGAYEQFMFAGDITEQDNGRGVLAENKDQAIVSARLTTETGDEVGALRLGEDAFFEFNVLTKRDCLNLFVGFDVFANLGTMQHVFRGLQPCFEAKRKGLYRIKVRVPADSFVDLHYKVNVSLVAQSGGVQKALVAPAAFGFKAYQLSPDAKTSGGGEARMKGLFVPKLVWSVINRGSIAIDVPADEYAASAAQ